MASTSALAAVVERLIEQTRKKWKAKDESATIYRKPPSTSKRKRKPRLSKKGKKPKFLN